MKLQAVVSPRSFIHRMLIAEGRKLKGIKKREKKERRRKKKERKEEKKTGGEGRRKRVKYLPVYLGNITRPLIVGFSCSLI